MFSAIGFSGGIALKNHPFFCSDTLNVKSRDIELHNIVRLDAKHQDRTPQPLLVSLPSVDEKDDYKKCF